jgi:uncharacterized cupredoxin-like copper-binding protein
MRMDRRLLVIIAAGLAALAAGGCGGGSHQTMTHDSAGGTSGGGPGSTGGTGAGAAARTVDVEMRDIAYVPTTVAVHAGETVKFVFHNKGQAVHEAFLGDEAAQAAHEKEMQGGDMGGMKGHEGNVIKVDPGKTGSLTHTFGPGESLLIGCHEPGHYGAGMKVILPVS